MADQVKPIPDGFHTVTPFFVVKDAVKFIEFIKTGFDAQEIHTSKDDDGSIMHAEFKIGSSIIMIAQAGERSPANSMTMYMYVEDCDASYNKAIKAGAESVSEPADQFYGDRTSGVNDQFGNQWWIGTHIENVSAEEIKKRQEELFKK